MKHPDFPIAEEGRRWPQVLTALTATIAVFTTGLHTGWPAPSLPKLLSEEYPHDISNDEASYITIIAFLGNLTGGFIGAALVDRIGRKKTILLIAFPQILSFFLIFMSYEGPILLYFARFVGGLSEGATFTIIPLYIAEIADPKIRGTLGTFMSIAVITGMLFVNIIGSYLSIKIAALIFLFFPLIFLVSFWKMPESPYFLLMKNHKEEAENALKFLRRKKNVSEELTILVKDVNRQMTESGNFSDIFKIESNRKAFTLIVGARLVQQWTGVSAFSLYTQLLFKEATESLPPEIASSLLLIVSLIMVFVLVIVVDKYGRKPLLLVSTGGCFIDLIIQGIYFNLKEYTDVDVSILDWFPVVMMVLFTILFSMGLGAAVNILSSEIFSASIKSKAICVVNVVFSLSMMATTKFYQATTDNFGLTVPYYSFAFCSFIGVLFIYFFLPETKGKSLEEIQQQLKGNKKDAKPIDNI